MNDELDHHNGILKKTRIEAKEKNLSKICLIWNTNASIL